MQIIRNRAVAANGWRQVNDQDPLPDGPIVVSLARWLKQRAELIGRSAPVGVRLGPGDPVDRLGQDLHSRPLVALESGGFSEGRCYSQARLLRERYAYQGEIRVLEAHPEHLAFLERCGVNAFELIDGYDPDQALTGIDEIDVRYQPAVDTGAEQLRWRRKHAPPRSDRDSARRERRYGR